MKLCKNKKFPTQHVTARYLARSYPKGELKKTSLGGPFQHLKFYIVNQALKVLSVGKFGHLELFKLDLLCKTLSVEWEPLDLFF